MKKFLILTAALLMVSANAATIQWAWKSSAAVKFDTTSLGSNGTAYLVYLGSDAEATDYSFAQLVEKASATTITTSTSLGKINAKPKMESSTAAGNYATVMSFVSGEKTYWNVSSTTYTITEEGITDLVENGTALPDSSFAFSNSVSSGSGTVGGGWAQVPEPSTAMLAIAGLALLLKRRKA